MNILRRLVLSICKHASSAAEFPFPYSPVGKTTDLMFLNTFSSMMTVTIQVTSTMQLMKQWNLYFSLFMVFTGRKSFNSLSTLFRMAGGKSAKRFPASYPQHFWLLILIIFTQSCKISGPYLVPVLNYWTWTKATPQKISFAGQIHIKLLIIS